jgi:DNA polymerase I
VQVIAFDTETELIAPAQLAPRMVCLTWHVEGEDTPCILHANDPGARAMFKDWITDPNVLLVGQNVAFDMAVCGAKWPDLVPAIFYAYSKDRVTCTKLRQQLVDIASGQFKGYADSRGVWRKHTYDLGFMAKRLLGKQLKKDGWRLRYAEFLDTPVEGWIQLAEVKRQEALALVELGSTDKDLIAVAEGPASDVITYPLEDATTTLGVYHAQERIAADVLGDQFYQARGQWWLALTSAWGMRTDAGGVAELRRATEGHVARLEAGLVASGLVRKDGSRDTKKATARMLEACGWAVGEGDFVPTRPKPLALRKTAGGGVCLDRDACKASDDPVLRDYGDLAQFKAVLAKDVPMLEAGVTQPIHTNYGLAETGRTTSAKPNLQNMRRLPGIREAFRPRAGKVFVQADYPQLELRTLAQACLDLVGHSELARMLNAGKDPHLAFAATIRGISYEEAAANKKRKDVDDARQIGKVFNFGSPGGLGAAKLVQFARKTYGVVLEEDQVRAYKRDWLATFPEMKDYFDLVGRLTDNPSGLGTLVQLRSGRIRGGVTYTASCNSFFQGLGADATKHAGFLVSREMYTNPASALFGTRIVLFVHDEIIAEADDDERAHDVAVELARIMREAANVYVPDVPFRAPDPEPLLMRVWSKDAKALLDARGRLIPWAPEPAEKMAA